MIILYKLLKLQKMKVMVPAMVCYDGFITSHAVENVTLLEDNVVKILWGENKRANDGLLGKIIV